MLPKKWEWMIEWHLWTYHSRAGDMGTTGTQHSPDAEGEIAPLEPTINLNTILVKKYYTSLG